MSEESIEVRLGRLEMRVDDLERRVKRVESLLDDLYVLIRSYL